MCRAATAGMCEVQMILLESLFFFFFCLLLYKDIYVTINMLHGRRTQGYVMVRVSWW